MTVPISGDYISEQLDRVLEENRRLLSLMEEKDKKISLLEFRVQQMMRDNLSRSEEQLRLQKENTALLRALTNITSVKQQVGGCQSCCSVADLLLLTLPLFGTFLVPFHGFLYCDAYK